VAEVISRELRVEGVVSLRGRCSRLMYIRAQGVASHGNNSDPIENYHEACTVLVICMCH
jgi:hypothetical protein